MTLEARVQVRVGELELEVDLTVGEGEVVALLGPNGAGKTTMLRVLAGLVALDRGRVTLDGVTLDDGSSVFVPPEQRSVGVVFQESLLFPHLSARENVAFGLRSRGVGRREARAVADEWLGRFGLTDRAHARPSALSGGQAQRIALARALSANPRLLLLDEPLGALDAPARADMRRTLRRHLGTFSGSRVVVTHDPLDAAMLADRVVIVEAGQVVQEGRLADITARPRSSFAAELAGVNLLVGGAERGRVVLASGAELHALGAPDGAVLAVVHPHAVALHRARPEGSPRNAWLGTVEGIELLGARARVRVVGPVPLVAEVTASALAELALADGDPVWAVVKATEVVVLPA